MKFSVILSLIVALLTVFASISFAETNAVLLIEAPPAYNECDGSLIESLAGTSISFGFTISEGPYLGGEEISGDFISFNFTIAVGSTLLKNTNSIMLIEAPPAYNECNGVLVESLPTGTSIFFGFIISEGPYLGGVEIGSEPISFGFTLAKGGALLRSTNAVLLIETVPNYDACDGSLIESLFGTTISFGFAIAESNMPHELKGDTISFSFIIMKPQQKIKFDQGVKFDQGIDFDGGNYIKWESNPNAALLAP